ncbi:MAG: 3',5'-cyclic-nucleotide phosphodiesterase, partial [Hydrogenophilales bacterium 17-64-11]
MKLTVLGCSGGIGSGRHTTSLLVDDDALIDAGSGLTTLDFEQLLKIDHVFLTHAHLDHVLGLPLLLDSVGDLRGTPVTVHALPAVL